MKYIPFKKDKKRFNSVYCSRTKGLQKCPQRKGTCLKIFKTTPRKPNAGNRNVTKVVLTSL
jgi:small subunit ribosomal protein S12